MDTNDSDTVFCLTQPAIPDSVVESIRGIPETHGYNVAVRSVADDADTYPSDAAYIVTMGGDGTFLEGIQHAVERDAPLVAINAGTLGFLARIQPRDTTRALEDVLTGADTVTTVERELLSVSDPVTGVGINDVMIEPPEPDAPTDPKVATVHVYIEDEYVGEFTGSGIAVASPTGSTAVSYSAGGPVHFPNANSSLQITPLLTHKGGVRPIIVDSSTEIRVIPDDPVTVSVDGGRLYAEISAGTELQVTGADESAHVVRTEYDDTFFDALTDKLGWGLRDVDDPGPYPQ